MQITRIQNNFFSNTARFSARATKSDFTQPELSVLGTLLEGVVMTAGRQRNQLQVELTYAPDDFARHAGTLDTLAAKKAIVIDRRPGEVAVKFTPSGILIAREYNANLKP